MTPNLLACSILWGGTKRLILLSTVIAASLSVAAILSGTFRQIPTSNPATLAQPSDSADRRSLEDVDVWKKELQVTPENNHKKIGTLCFLIGSKYYDLCLGDFADERSSMRENCANAAKYLHRAERMYKNSPTKLYDVYDKLAHAYEISRDFERCEKYSKLKLEVTVSNACLDDRRISAWLNWGSALDRLHKTAEAEKAFRKGLDLVKRSSSYYETASGLAEGMALEMKIEEAYVDLITIVHESSRFKEALKLQDDYIRYKSAVYGKHSAALRDVYNQKVYMLRAMGDTEGASRTLAQIKKLNLGAGTDLSTPSQPTDSADRCALEDIARWKQELQKTAQSNHNKTGTLCFLIGSRYYDLMLAERPGGESSKPVLDNCVNAVYYLQRAEETYKNSATKLYSIYDKLFHAYEISRDFERCEKYSKLKLEVTISNECLEDHLASAWLDWGMSLSSVGQTAEAEKAYRKSLDLFKRNKSFYKLSMEMGIAIAYSDLIEILCRSSRLKEALELQDDYIKYKSAVCGKHCSALGDAYKQKADILNAMGDKEEASRTLAQIENLR